MFFNPAYYKQTLNLLSLENHPGSIFEEQAKDLQWLTEKIKARLAKAAIKCKELFHVGNLVTDYQLPSSSEETSQELAPLTKNIYRVIRVDPLTARIVNFFTGQARTLPLNHLRRLYISDLTYLRYFCTNRYLQNMQHKLYKQNKLTNSDQSQT